MAGIKEVFTLFDSDAINSVPVSDIPTMMRGLGQLITQAEIDALVAVVDEEGKVGAL